ncbi:MAG: S9 family peptidase, partial [Caldilineaceae bacterium]|nr:S9 family peptidase [Caldilineaceae bacterium]
LRFTYTLLVTPDTVFDYDMQTRHSEQKKKKVVLGGYDPARYETERIFATAADGAQVPISLVRRKDTPHDRPSPLLLNGYGSYGVSNDPDFNSNRISLLDRGVTFAIAHVRGGGEMGRPWYENGKFLHKKNTFGDFAACAQHLVDQGYTSPDLLGATGRSAGGLLMGAVANLRPDLFKVIIAGVPFVDVINTMLDASIPLTAVEYEEWGNPNDPQFYVYMKSYAPYENVEAKAYPHILATAGLNDPRVQYWEPAKWVAKLRTLKTDSNRLLLKTNMGAGHGGASGRFDYLEEVAFEYAFLLELLGVTVE